MQNIFYSLNHFQDGVKTSSILCRCISCSLCWCVRNSDKDLIGDDNRLCACEREELVHSCGVYLTKCMNVCIITPTIKRFCLEGDVKVCNWYRLKWLGGVSRSYENRMIE